MIDADELTELAEAGVDLGFTEAHEAHQVVQPGEGEAPAPLSGGWQTFAAEPLNRTPEL